MTRLHNYTRNFLRKSNRLPFIKISKNIQYNFQIQKVLFNYKTKMKHVLRRTCIISSKLFSQRTDF